MLDNDRILFCDWNKAGGSLEYDISHLHPDWSVVIQAYDVRSVTHDGRLIYSSDFTLYLAGSAVPADFTVTPKKISGYSGKQFLPSSGNSLLRCSPT